MVSQRIPVVAIVGRTNVGKSTLFNAIAGRRIAVVEDEEGVTRDRNYHLVERFGAPFSIVDTGGLAGEQDLELQATVKKQAELAILEADLVIALFDAKHGPHPHDEEVVQLLRRSGKKILWVVNKCEKEHMKIQAHEFYGLGLEELIFVSASNNVGIKDLVARIHSELSLTTEQIEQQAKSTAIRVAIVGRPNVGKSTLINKLVGEERLVAYDKPGTTRDCVDVEISRDGQNYVLVDTAGLRRKSKVDQGTVERFANLRALTALAHCDVAVLIVDATQGMPTDQDIRIATIIHERGRSFVIAVTKWDLVEKDSKTSKDYEEMVYASFAFARYAPILFISGLTGQRCPNVLDKVKEVYEACNTTYSDAQVKEVISTAMTRNVPPVYHGEPISCHFSGQIGNRPPTFVMIMSQPRGIGASYERYIRSALREAFPFPGNDIRIIFRKKTRRAVYLEAAEREEILKEFPANDSVEAWGEVENS